MNNKKLTLLGIVAAIMVVLTIGHSYLSHRSVRKGDLDIPLIQGLETKDIISIRLGAPDKIFTLRDEGNQFALLEKGGYPVSIKKINTLIASLLDIRVAEFITDNPLNHKDLELTEETAGSIIKLFNEKDELLTGIILGKRSDLEGGTYVRMVSKDLGVNNKAYLSFNVPWLDMAGMGYIDKKLLKLAKGDIVKVEVLGPEGGYRMIAGADGKVMLEDVPEGKKTKDTVYERVFNAGTDLEFIDVQRESEFTADLDFKSSYSCELKDSRIYTFRLAQREGKTFIRCFSEFTDPTPVVKKRGVESDEELKQKEAKLLARDASIEFNEKNGGWIYEIPGWKAADMTREFEALIEDQE